MTARRWAPAVVLLALIAALLQTRSYDVWWHLEAGEWIASARAVPRVDDFSFTSRGAPWVDHEWLFQLVILAAHASMGFAGIFLLKGATAAATLVIGVWASRRLGRWPCTPPLALLLAAVSAVGMRPRLAERPEIVAFPLAAAVTAVALSLASRPAGAWRRLAALGLLTVLWVNLHASALLAPALLFAVSAGCLVDRWRVGGVSSSGARMTAAGGALAAVCLLANPYTTELLEVPLRIAGALAPSNMVNPEWGSPSWSDFPFFYVCATVMVVLSGISILRGEPLAASRAAVLAAVTALGFWSIRHIGIFFAVVPLVAPSGMLQKGAREPGARWWGEAACLAAVAWMLLFPPPGARIGAGIQTGRFPVEAAAFAGAHLADARLYNDVAFGGYLIRDAYPVRRVFVDGRNEVHASLLKEMSEAMDDGLAWRSMLSRHGVEGAIVQYRPQPIEVRQAGTEEASSSTWSELHFPPLGWALVHWDDVAMVFVRRDGKYAPLAARSEYLFIRPEAFRLGLDGTRPGAPAQGAAREVARRLLENPRCPLAKEMAAVYGSGHPPGR